ncbi:hypothetical protein K431DRAFT_316899 [Polychaeton citri CBS 116435]|uniref:Zn(2)-C6 fungal-type domain-containing protein n=1 Tax=Polychaeton citri CBS 116435 TaxID=1314669 RepID=A0A9P4PXM1_9PEZI|nr:hypothetical protein K431DRAFT_316899 [Polychaeton citri CBS 116435]
MSETPENSQRRERAAIAAQACQTCRNRKSKCDEQRPKCGLCRRLNVECQYREPLPTKKDKTMVHILETLARLENKFDNLSLSKGGSSPQTSASSSRNPETLTSERSSAKRSWTDFQHEFPTGLQQAYHHLTVPHKTILWPSIYIHLVNSGIQGTSDLQYIMQEGTPWFIRQEMMKHPTPLTHEVGLPSFSFNPASREQGYATRWGFPTLSIQQIQKFADAYFDTFNILTPILNRDSFMNEIVAPLLREGYSDGEPSSVIALLVFALGQVAVDGIYERPIGVSNGMPSGFRGGVNADHPPGLDIFNEARRRLGFVVSQCSLQSVQMHLLMGTYYESNARHLDFWRSTVTAAMDCQVLLKCQTVDWTSPHGDLIKRIYWTCILNEDLYHLDLDLPQTGLCHMEEEVPMPGFHELSDPSGSTGLLSEERSHLGYHFLAMIALRKLIRRIHSVIHDSSSTHQSETADDYGGPPVHVIRELARQLDSWRSLLPRPLQWSDHDKFDFPNPDPTARRPDETLFSPDQGAVPIGHKSNLDIVTAQLRTRFYYARFMMYRPFVYKALHFPELMSVDDASCCALAIKSACLWPVCMAPPKNKKRLVPHLFAWTQNFIGILLILRMTSENECLRAICEEQVNLEEIQRTISLMMEWIRDVRQVDGIADWGWRVLEPLYASPRSLRDHRNVFN